MASDDVITLLSCSINDKPSHIVSSPVSLSCGHCICKECIPFSQTFKIKCKICNCVNEHDLSNVHESPVVKYLLKQQLNKLFDYVEVRVSNSIKQYKELIANINDKIDLQIEYVKEELSIRFESIKIELENIHKNLQDELDLVKIKYSNWTVDANYIFNKQDGESVLNQLEKLSNNIKQNKEINEATLYSYQNKLQYLNSIINDLVVINPEIKLDVSEMNVGTEMFGTISTNYSKMINEPLIKRIKSFKYEIIKLNEESIVEDMCVLPNQTIIVAYSKFLCLFDKSFNLIKRIEKVNDMYISPFCVTYIKDTNSVYAICSISENSDDSSSDNGDNNNDNCPESSYNEQSFVNSYFDNNLENSLNYAEYHENNSQIDSNLQFNYNYNVDNNDVYELEEQTEMENLDENEMSVDGKSDKATIESVYTMLKIDLDFEVIEKHEFILDSNSNSPCVPYKICAYDKFIYICDSNNNTIKVLDFDLNIVNSFELDYRPENMKIHNDVMCISSSTDSGIYFYKVDPFRMHQQYSQNYSGLIGCIGSSFYVYDDGNKIMDCYDYDGNLIETIETDGFDFNIENNIGEIVCFENKILICSFNTQEIICV